MKWLEKYFDRVVAINLDRRPDRWQELLTGLEDAHWPFKKPERVPAVDGDACTVPIWWKQGGGAWGCMMSHARILEDCIRSNVQRVLILEDDVTFVDDLPALAESFLRHVPDDWDQLYFGGQHLHDPRKYNDHVFQGINVNRTHCHAVSRKFMPRMYRYILNAHDYIANPGHHIDHRLGALQETGTVKVYSPVQWLAGQAEGRSDISGRTNDTFFWNTWAGVPEMTLFVILGLHESGGTDIGGLLLSMGVHFGHNLTGFRPPLIEDEGLARICERVYPFPTTDRELPLDESTPLLYDWCYLIQQEAANYGTVAAAYYPHLCGMYEDMTRAWRNIKVINVKCSQDLATEALSIRSQMSSGWLSISRNQVEAVQEMLQRRKRQWLENCEHISVEPQRVVSDRPALVEDLSNFMGLRKIANKNIESMNIDKS